jgi:hypothetical protein
LAVPGSLPVIVCASGPSLEDSVPEIANRKKSPSPPFIIAVSSSAPVLLQRGIKPDLVIATDGGSWALFHLIETIRQSEKKYGEKPVIVSALRAALPSYVKNCQVIVLRDGSLWQDLLLNALGILELSPAFPQRGTVSVSALDLAFYLSSGNVYRSGFDFSHRDLLTHARPNAFEIFLEQKQKRTIPLNNLFFEREETIRRSGSLGIYERWLKNHLFSFNRKLYTLGEPGFDNGGESIRFTGQNAKKIPGKKFLVDTLCNALHNPLCTERLCKELGTLLLPEYMPQDKFNAEKIKKALIEMTGIMR